jgi:gamma-tubulin complex component 6
VSNTHKVIAFIVVLSVLVWPQPSQHLFSFNVPLFPNFLTYTRYQLVSMFTIRLFQEGLCLQNHYAALRRYYFMERGDWAEYFLTALCQHEWGHTGGQPCLLEVQAMLETALQSSSCEGDEYAERLYVVIHDEFEANPSSLHKSHPQFSHRSRVPGPFVSRNCLGAFDCFKLGYKVDWPIGLILTPTALSLYSEVFTFLMRTKLTVYGLEDTWQYLQVWCLSCCPVMSISIT